MRKMTAVSPELSTGELKDIEKQEINRRRINRRDSTGEKRIRPIIKAHIMIVEDDDLQAVDLRRVTKLSDLNIP